MPKLVCIGSQFEICDRYATEVMVMQSPERVTSAVPRCDIHAVLSNPAVASMLPPGWVLVKIAIQQ